MTQIKHEMTHSQWLAYGSELFGDDIYQWRFVCPSCGYIARVQEWIDAGAPKSTIAFSCVGRWHKTARPAFGSPDLPGPCDYAGGGLFRLNPVRVTHPDGKTTDAFAFAEPPR